MDGSDRELCPDGACIGLIGPDGICKECGMSADGTPAEADDDEDDLDDYDDDDEDDDDDDDEDDDDDYDEDDDDDDDDGDDWDDGDDESEDLGGWDEDVTDDDLEEDGEDGGDGDRDENDLFAAGSAFDELHRELCSDGACVGVIGADGRCRECGKPGRNARLDPRQRGMRTDAEMADDGDDDAGDLDIAVATPLPADHDFQSRELCPDGACIGLIGPDGRCRECGKRA